jgi:DNA polymerase-1
MEDRGPALDHKYFKLVKKVVPKRAEDLLLKLRQMADDPEFNPASPVQCLDVIYDKLGLPVVDEEEGRNTKEETLKIISAQSKHPFPQDLLDYRMYSKMDSTYLKGYKRSADMNGGELRTKWFLTGAVTGRLRSGGTKEGFKGKVNMQNLHGNPFLQNLLISDHNWRLVLEWGKRGGRIPDEILDLEIFLASDYSQVEIRMLAEVSKDKLLCKQFLDAYNSPDPTAPASDIHCLVGHALNPKWSLDFIKSDKKIRTFIKSCHFGLVYGLSENGLYFYLKGMGVDATPEMAADFHQKYFQKYKGVARYIAKMRAFGEEHGYVDTIFGFRRYISGNWDEDRETSPQNQAVNTPIQGAAHTMLLAAMALLYKKPQTYKLLKDIIMEVHDSLVFRVKLRDLPEAFQLCSRLMEKETPRFVEKLFGKTLHMPLLAEATVGFRYGAQEDYAGEKVTEFLPKWLEKNQKVEEKIRKEFKIKKAA